MGKHTIIALATAAMLALTACEQPTPATQVEPPPPKVVTVTIAADGTVALNGEVVARADLRRRFEAFKQAGTEVHLSPDRNASYAAVRDVLNTAIETGLSEKMGVIGGT